MNTDSGLSEDVDMNVGWTRIVNSRNEVRRKDR